MPTYMAFTQGQILELINQVIGTMTLMLGGIALPYLLFP